MQKLKKIVKKEEKASVQLPTSRPNDAPIRAMLDELWGEVKEIRKGIDEIRIQHAEIRYMNQQLRIENKMLEISICFKCIGLLSKLQNAGRINNFACHRAQIFIFILAVDHQKQLNELNKLLQQHQQKEKAYV